MEAPSTPPGALGRDNTSRQMKDPRLREEFLFLVHQYLRDEFPEIIHSYFASFISAGEWKKADQYFCAFVDPKSKFGAKICFHLRKTWLYECVFNGENQKAFDILMNELGDYKGKKPYTELVSIVACKSIADAPSLKDFNPTKARAKLIEDLEKNMKEASPQDAPPMKYPKIPSKRLTQLVNQALNAQHKNCLRKDKKEFIVETLFEDHRCPADTTISSPSSSSNIQPDVRPSSPPPQRVTPVQGSVQKTSSSITKTPTSTQANGASSLPHSDSNTPLTSNKRSLPSTEPQVQKKQRAEETTLTPVATPTSPSDQPPPLESKITPDAIPSTIQSYLRIPHTATSLRFNPVYETILAVGTSDGTTQIWDISEGKMMSQKSVGNYVKRLAWSPDGKFVGVATRSTVLYVFELEGTKMQERLRMPKHREEINDLVFYIDNQKKTFLVTASKDKTCGVFNVIDKTVVTTWGEKEHDDSVVSLISGNAGKVSFVAAACKNGKLHLYIDPEGKHLISKDFAQQLYSFAVAGEDVIICAQSLWRSKLSDLKVDLTYSGYEPPSDPSKPYHVAIGIQQIIALPSKHQVKFWLKDESKIAKSIRSDWEVGDVSFSASGNIIAFASANVPVISIATNAQGISKIKNIQPKPDFSESSTREVTSTLPPLVAAPTKSALAPIPARIDNRNVVETKPPPPSSHIRTFVHNNLKYHELIPKEPRKFVGKIVYTSSSSGDAITLLADDKIHEFFKISLSEDNASILVPPHSGVVDNGGKGARFYNLAITQNDLYHVISVGDRIQLFHSKKLTYVSGEKMTYGASDPKNPGTPTSLVLADDNNIFFVGLAEDCSIRIFNVSKQIEIEKLQGPSSRITSMIYEQSPTTLISAHEDGKIFFFRLKKTTTEETNNAQKKATIVSSYKLDASEPVKTISLGDKPIIGLSYRKSKKQLLAVQKTALHTKMLLKTFPFTNISAGQFSQTEKPLIIFGGEDGLISIAELTPEMALKQLQVDKLQSGFVTTISVHPTTESFAIGTSDGKSFVVQYMV